MKRGILVLDSKLINELQPYLVIDVKPENGDIVYVFAGTGNLNAKGSRIWEYRKAPCPMPYWGNPNLCWKVIASPVDFDSTLLHRIATGEIKSGQIISI